MSILKGLRRVPAFARQGAGGGGRVLSGITHAQRNGLRWSDAAAIYGAQKDASPLCPPVCSVIARIIAALAAAAGYRRMIDSMHLYGTSHDDGPAAKKVCAADRAQHGRVICTLHAGCDRLVRHAVLLSQGRMSDRTGAVLPTDSRPLTAR